MFIKSYQFENPQHIIMLAQIHLGTIENLLFNRWMKKYVILKGDFKYTYIINLLTLLLNFNFNNFNSKNPI